MAKTLNEAGQKTHVAEIVTHGEKLILPEKMEIDDAIKLLERRKSYLQEEVQLDETFDAFPWDGANAFAEVLEKRYGWVPATATPGFFGPTPPKMISIEVAPGKTRQIPWGRFSLPNVAGWVHTAAGSKDGRVVFRVVAQVLRKDEATVKALLDDVRAHLKQASIYRGQAIKLRFRDDDGDKLEMPEPKFLNTNDVNEEMLVYSADVQASIETNLFTPITRVQDCLANGVPVKRGVLLGGTYGTGKTLAAKVASKLAVQSGVTYIYVPRADELADAIEFAKQYQSPAAVIFCEDIDRVMAGERNVAMDDILNIIDGIDTKSANIVVVLTTNDLNAINPAMLRPGRLDAVIEVTAPDAKAVEKLLRVYGGAAIATTTDLTEAGKALDGAIPAVISEVVKRAKLAQLRLQKPGEKVAQLSEAALLEAAKTMRSQLQLLKSRSEATYEKPALDQALSSLVSDAVKDATDRIASKVAEIADNI